MEPATTAALISAGGGLIGGLLGRKKQKSTTKVSLDPQQQKVYDDYMPGVGRLLNQGPPKYFEGPTVAARTGDTIQGLDAWRQFATGAAPDMVNRAIAVNNAWLDPAILTNLNAIPGYSGMSADISRRVMQALTEQALPSIRSSRILAGGYGDSKNQQSQGLAVGRSMDNLAGQLSNLGLNTWTNAAGLQQNAQQMIPMLLQAGMQPGQILQMVGGADQAYAQQLIDAAMAKHSFEQQAPYAHLDAVQKLLGRVGDYGGTTTSIGPSNTLTGAMQGLGAGAYLATLFGKPPGAAGPGAAGPTGPGAFGATPSGFDINHMYKPTMWNPITGGGY